MEDDFWGFANMTTLNIKFLGIHVIAVYETTKKLCEMSQTCPHSTLFNTE